MARSLSEVTILLRKMRSGETEAQGRLAELVYTELRRLASSKMRGERSDHTLTPTALANEAWLRLVDCEEDFASRSHFFAIAANAMRRILVDYARARNAAKRGGGEVIRVLQNIDPAAPACDYTLLALDEALDVLSKTDHRAASVVEMRYFGGLTHKEIAEALNVDRRTVDRDWAVARAWLFDRLSASGVPSPTDP